MSFKNSPVSHYIRTVIDKGFSVLPEPVLKDEDIATAFEPHIHKLWELKFINPSRNNPRYMVVFTAPNVVHATTQKCNLSVEINYHKIYFSPRFSQFWKNQILDEECLSLNIMPELLQALNKVKNAKQFAKISQDLMSSILNNLLSLLELSSKRQSVPVKNSPLDNAISYMQNNYFKADMGVGDVARFAGVSPQYLNILFRRKTAKTTRQTLIEIRLAHAKELLDSENYFIKDIARLTGWHCPFHFCNCFKKRYGITPSSV